jgi:hypothetical protein
MGGPTSHFSQAIGSAEVALPFVSFRRVNQLDEGSVLAEELHLCSIKVSAGGDGLRSLKDLGGVLARLRLVDVLELDVDLGLGLHVRDATAEWQAAVLGMETLDRLGDDPEAGPLCNL